MDCNGDRCCSRGSPGSGGQIKRGPTILRRRMPAMMPWAIIFVALKLAGQRSQAGFHLNHETLQFVPFDLASGNGKLVPARPPLRTHPDSCRRSRNGNETA